jgi:hypothetical protein
MTSVVESTRSETRLRVTVLDADLASTPGMWGDSSGGWQPDAVAWVGRLAALGVPFDVVAQVDGPVGGLLVDPSGTGAEAAADAGVVGPPPETAEETLQLLADRLGAIVVPDLRGLLVLRLDDPGSAVKDHLRSWAHQPVTDAGWAALWRALDGFGRVSLFCCPGYVRPDGSVVDSRAQLPDEWRQLDHGVARGLADLECHGFTHMHPDTAAWAASADRHDDVGWYRELWPPCEPVEPSVEAQAQRVRAWQAAVGGAGTTLVAPGEEWGLNTLAAAQRCGLALFNSWGICFLDRDVPVWTYGVGSPYLDEPDPAWFADCLPQVGYWHDRDLAVNGPGWIGAHLDAWRDCGAKRAASFADLAAAYAPVDAVLLDGDVVVRSAPEVPLRVVRRR